MKEQEYKEFVNQLVKDPELIIQQLTPEKADLWHMATGVSGEAGELLDAVKKYAVYGKPIDLENVKEELGDLKFYMTRIMSTLGLSDEDLRVINHKKLSKRYSSGSYSDQQAINRADKTT